MNATRKKQVVTIADAEDYSGWYGFARKHANTALTVLLVIAAIAMVIRWRMRTAEAARLTIANELSNARSLVNQLSGPQLTYYPPADLIKTIQSLENGASSSIATVLTSNDNDPALRAQALRLRGDLYWKLANFPPITGSTTQPSLQMSESSDVLLQKAWDSYQELLHNSTYADQHEERAAARLGVAAIDENRGDWAAAKTELQAVSDDSNTPAILATTAKIELEQLPNIEKPIYVAPPSGSEIPATAPAEPIGPLLPLIPTTRPTSVPTTMPMPH
jgi:type II secretory pathway pseudopilin PulG